MFHQPEVMDPYQNRYRHNLRKNDHESPTEAPEAKTLEPVRNQHGRSDDVAGHRRIVARCCNTKHRVLPTERLPLPNEECR